MSSTVSYILREAWNPNAAELRFVDVRATTLWNDEQVVVVELVGVDTLLRLPLTDDFTERFDVVRRVSAPRPSLDARSVRVTFANLSYVTPGGQHPTHEVELWTELPLERADLDFEELAAAAADVWTEVDWSADDPGWWVTSVTLPDGTVVTIDDALGGRDVGPRRK